MNKKEINAKKPQKITFGNGKAVLEKIEQYKKNPDKYKSYTTLKNNGEIDREG